MQEELDITKLRYVLYVRKSTDDPQRQIRSIDDQISECFDYAKRLKLHIVGSPIEEKKSAKKPDQRPLFTQMLRDIRKGKYDGILAWNPDRLARNMKEGGEVIDMIDDKLIKDMKFVTHHFSNDANGKMLLGMAFVLSKQYSDNLSQNVTRGVRKNFGEGKTPVYKYGYIRDTNGLQQPDGKNFDLLKEAWKKRLEGISLDEIAEYMNQNGFRRVIKLTKRHVAITKQMLSGLFQDKFYYGVLVQKEEEIDLRSIYDFQGAVTEEEFYKIQVLSGKRMQPYKKKRVSYYPLKMMVVCSFCGNHMYVGAVQGHKYKYLTYRCDNKYCTRQKKSIRGKVIFDFIYDLLQNGINFTEEDYQKYLEDMKQLTGKKHEELKAIIYSKEGRLKILEHEIREIAYKVLKFDEDSPIRRVNEKRVEDYEIEKDQIKSELVTLKGQLVDPDQQIITLENFLNLSKNAGKAVQTDDPVIKDAICRLLFLNFSVDEKKVLSYQAKPPFDTLIKTHDVLFSRQ